MFVPFSWNGPVYAGGGGGGSSTPIPVSISGGTTDGSVLSVSGVPSGMTVTAYQWRRNGVNISGATNATYTIGVADSNTTISCVVSAVIAGKAIPALPDVTAPTRVSQAVQGAAPTIIVFTVSETLDAASIPATSAFTVTGKTVSGVSISGSTFSLTVNAPFVYGDVITASYTQPGANRLRDPSGNLLASFSNVSVTNNIVQPGTVETTFDGLYSVGWQPDKLRDVKTQPALTYPAKTTNILSGGYVDPTFGTQMRVITDITEVGISGNTTNVHDYSRHNAFNANSTRYNTQSTNGFHYIYDAATCTKLDMGGTNPAGLGALPGFAGNCEPIWHPTDPNLIYRTANTGDMLRYEFNIATKTSRTYYDLTTVVRALPGMSTAAKCWSEGEGDPSMDFDYWGFRVENSSGTCLGAVVYRVSTNTIVWYKAWTGNTPNWVSVDPTGTYVVVSHYGTSNGSLAAETAAPLTGKAGANVYLISDGGSGAGQALSCLGEHSCLALDYLGRPVYVSVSFSPGDALSTSDSVYMRLLSDPSQVTVFALNVLSPNATGAQFHFGGTCSWRRNGWITVAKGPGVGSGAFDGQVMLLELVPAALNPIVFRLFQHRASGGAQESSPVPTANFDITRVLSHTQANGGNVSIAAVLPSFAIPVAGARAPAALTAPTITGSATPGGTLTRTAGTYGGLPAPTVSGIWQQSANGTTGWTDISGQTGGSYVVGVGNGIYLRYFETANNGTSPNATQASNVLLVASLAAPLNTVAPSAPATSDTATAVTATQGTWTGNPVPTYAYVWQRDISSTWTDSAFTTLTATLTPVGSWRLKVTATNNTGTTNNVIAYSNTVAVSAPAGEPVPSSTVTFTGANGTTLEALNAAWDGDTRYQIQSNALQNMNPFGAGWGLAYYTLAGGTNQAVQVSMEASAEFSGSSDRTLDIHMHANATQFGYICQADGTSIRLFRVTDTTQPSLGGASQVVSSVAHGVNTVTTALTIKVTELNGRIRAYVNGSSTPAFDYTDSAKLTGGYCGLRCYPGATESRIRITNFLYGSS